jgi:hypothetical protein
MNLRLPAIAFGLTLASAAAVFACAAAPPRDAKVDIADESAIIIWDSVSKTEHFIRRAQFTSNVQEFGFLVPTPSRPTLAEAPDAAFDHLAETTAPRTVTEVQYDMPGIGCAASPRGETMMAAGVAVLEQKRVAGYDAAVLAADDPAALNQWLGDHGYESRPALTAWLEPYTKGKWTVTAFKIAANDKNARGVATTAVRMSFQADRPFFPYREPEDQRIESANPTLQRLFRVFFIGDGRHTGQLGTQPEWPGKTVWANVLPEKDRTRLFEDLKLPPSTGVPWLTELEDRSSPRPGTDDVYFSRTGDQSPVERPPHIKYVYTTSIIATLFVLLAPLALIVGVIFLVRRLASAPNRSKPEA